MTFSCKDGVLEGVKIITPPTIFEDFRGDYVEIYNRDIYHEAGISTDFKQDDYATSTKNVLRGMHGDDKTEKLVKCIYGTLHFVVLQADESHPQFMQWEAHELSSTNRKQIYAPAGYAIGYLVLSDAAVFHYKQSTYYHETKQFTIKWNDPRAKIEWPIENPVLSERDS
ncbi:MAG: dTDP-4-dehydrorhamnose 3,5-epimerase family protein [Hyphomicrobiaceae bacterium]|nr:dTDP-4-dehydrorhamnose 3,5-epimerase family protein [Hyphomicrobiaceae bacterium]